ncbi:MAG: hypothetical protein ACXVB1_10485, partial [Pseudobdellovibrionaceae bacterium]
LSPSSNPQAVPTSMDRKAGFLRHARNAGDLGWISENSVCFQDGDKNLARSMNELNLATYAQ